jgi:glutamine synthetase
MFKTASEVVKFIKDNDVKFLDVRFTDLPGVQQHFNLPAAMIDEQFFIDGQLFDGSSIRGFASIHESDMQLIPDVTTAYLDAFRVEKTLIMVFDIYNPRNGEIYGRDPRQVAKKAQAYLNTTGLADTAFLLQKQSFSSSMMFDTRTSRTPLTISSTAQKLLGTPAAKKKAETSPTRLLTRVATSLFPLLTSM